MPYEYLWSTGETTPDILFLPSQTWDSVWVRVVDANLDTARAGVMVWSLDECVWPGDANGDGIANNSDLLYLGKALGATGYIRPNAHLNWVAQPAHSWGHSFPQGVNYAHADGDGNGLVDTSDIQAILHNYVAPAPTSGSPSGPNGIPIQVTYSASNVYPGDTVHIYIDMGTPTHPVDSITGVAFSIQFDSYLIDSNLVSIDYSTSWFGQQHVSMKTLEKVFGSQVDIGMIKTDKLNVVGSGRLTDITVVVDDIAGKQAGIEMISFNLVGASVRNANGGEMPVVIQNSQLGIVLGKRPTPLTQFKAGVDEAGMLSLSGPLRDIQSISLIDISGRQAFASRQKLYGTRWEKPVSDLTDGIYILSIETQSEIMKQKIVIR